jgi:dephospho-CoA kinase
METTFISTRPSAKPVLVGFAGPIGSGKTSAAKYLRDRHGFQYIRYSQVLRGWATPPGSGRAELREIGWEVMSGGRQRDLNQRLIDQLDPGRSAAIDGMRHITDYESLSSTFGSAFEMIFLEARDEERYNRLTSRFRTHDEFLAADQHPVEAGASALRPLAALVLNNDGSLEELYAELEMWLRDRDAGGKL